VTCTKANVQREAAHQRLVVVGGVIAVDLVSPIHDAAAAV